MTIDEWRCAPHTTNENPALESASRITRCQSQNELTPPQERISFRVYRVSYSNNKKWISKVLTLRKIFPACTPRNLGGRATRAIVRLYNPRPSHHSTRKSWNLFKKCFPSIKLLKTVSDDGHDRPSRKELLIGKRKDKKDKKDRGYATLEGESSPDEDVETKYYHFTIPYTSDRLTVDTMPWTLVSNSCIITFTFYWVSTAIRSAFHRYCCCSLYLWIELTKFAIENVWQMFGFHVLWLDTVDRTRHILYHKRVFSC